MKHPRVNGSRGVLRFNARWVKTRKAAYLSSNFHSNNRRRTETGHKLFVSVLFLIPTQFPNAAQTGFLGQPVKRISPMESINHFIEKLLVNNRTFAEMASSKGIT